MRVSAPVRRRVRSVLLVAVVALYVLSVPWYRSGGGDAQVWLGLPDWVAVALLCYAAAAVCNALAWLVTDVSDDGSSEDDA
jgi:hypothetical protein